MCVCVRASVCAGLKLGQRKMLNGYNIQAACTAIELDSD